MSWRRDRPMRTYLRGAWFDVPGRCEGPPFPSPLEHCSAQPDLAPLPAAALLPERGR
jgi:hypothetical protein